MPGAYYETAKLFFGKALVDFLRDLDAQYGGLFTFLFQDIIGSGIAPPYMIGVILPGNVYNEPSGTPRWYANLGLVAHEIAHHMTSGTRDRISTRSEAMAYQIQGQIQTDLSNQGHGSGASGAAAQALLVNMSNESDLRTFQKDLIRTTRDIPSKLVYQLAPVKVRAPVYRSPGGYNMNNSPFNFD